jgi:photosystem II stability/assembly factor-like uncharacterized protein
MRKIRFNIIILGLIIAVFLCANASADIQDMKLLTTKIGWVVTETNLYWTTDAGSTWHNITPPSTSFGHIAAVFFSDTSQGWVLCCDTSGKHYRFNVSCTKDSGKTWSMLPVQMPAVILEAEAKKDAQPRNGENIQLREIYQGTGWIDFLDPLHGWILLQFPVSARLPEENGGSILKTEDGGKTWRNVSNDVGMSMAGRFHFLTTKDGWLAGDIDLYVTHNGGNTWQQVLLTPPSQVSVECWYDLPIFKDSQNGFLPVTYVSNDLVLFMTHDGGKTWKPNWVLPKLPDTARALPSTVVDSVLITFTSSDTERLLTLIKVLPDGKIIKTTTDALHIKGNITPHSLYFSTRWQLSFINSKQGWVTTNSNQLLSTDDGGETWSVITPQ